MNAPEKIGAFFDIDGTLLPPPSLEWRFLAWLIARDELGGRDVTRWLAQLAKTLWHDPRGATLGNKKHLAGLRESLAADWGDSRTPDSLPLFERGAERVAWHLGQGHRVFLVSGTLAPLARIIARRISGRVEVRATELELSDARWTGRLAGEHLRGEAKARAVRALASRYDLELGESYAYGNCLADLPMLECVGRPAAVNPSVGFERIACSEGNADARRTPSFGWQVHNWKEAPLASAAHPRHLASTETR
ncbi:MAG: HAD-IB family hydrolase [Candidatus Acidiferrales bacterium]|jgi:HAD superfamily hydrolase (TIGR01490 family)